ncbi:unnamed protein product, partial [Mesorhabditis belari]|uniref:Uncharacterized protein n=1 Tax=Mesorhabditis belari TaxID=2138241 RepID=A0AAF3EQU6_9BILA
MQLQLLLFINMSIVYDDGWEAYIWMGYCIEILFYLLTAFAVPITYKLLSSTPIFHPNMLMIFFTAIFSIYIFAASRLGLIYYEAQPDLTCEIYAETIDTCPTMLIVFSILRAFDFALVPGFISRILAVLLALWISFSSALSTQLVIRINEKKEERLHISDYSLSKRYQLSENIRSAQLLSYLLWFTTVNNTIIGGVWIVHSTNISPSMRNIIGTFLTIFMAFYFCVTSVFGIFVNRRIYILWKALARAKLRKFL